MNKDTIIDILGIVALISVLVFCGYKSYGYMKYVDGLVEQHRIELLGK